MDMEKSMLTVPRGTIVQFVDEKTGEHTDGMFISAEDSRDFIVVPLATAQKSSEAGEPLFVRYGVQEGLVEFRSAIVEVIDYPITMWRIQVPTEINQFTLRGYERIQCDLSASVEVADQGLFIPAIIRNISKSGARCVFQGADGGSNLVRAEDAITLRCSFPGLPGKQAAAGKITTVFQTDDELSVGIQFFAPQAWVPSYH